MYSPRGISLFCSWNKIRADNLLWLAPPVQHWSLWVFWAVSEQFSHNMTRVVPFKMERTDHCHLLFSRHLLCDLSCTLQRTPSPAKHTTTCVNPPYEPKQRNLLNIMVIYLLQDCLRQSSDSQNCIKNKLTFNTQHDAFLQSPQPFSRVISRQSCIYVVNVRVQARPLIYSRALVIVLWGTLGNAQTWGQAYCSPLTC